VEFGIMLLGATPTQPTEDGKAEAEALPAAADAGEDVEMKDAEASKAAEEENVLDTDEFWDGLRGWLDGKVGAAEAKRLAGLFRKAAIAPGR